MNLKTYLSVGAAVVGLTGVLSAPASANFMFSGSGASGNFVGEASEPWIFNADIPFDNWGSPGVGAGTTPYLEAEAAYGMDITFFGVGPIDRESIEVGNSSNCIGASGGGTTFCNEPFGADGIWQAFLTGPNSISFRAQNEGQILETGEFYFVNVLFSEEGADPDGFSFEGVWLTEFDPNPAPVPGILPLFATGLGIMGLVARRRKAYPA